MSNYTFISVVWSLSFPTLKLFKLDFGDHFLNFGSDIFLVDKDTCNPGFENKFEIFMTIF